MIVRMGSSWAQLILGVVMVALQVISLY
jgi:hypothetical protein